MEEILWATEESRATENIPANELDLFFHLRS